MSLLLTRVFFGFLSVFFMVTHMIVHPGGDLFTRLTFGVFLGSALFLLLMGSEILFRRLHLRSFNTAMVGLFFGYLMGGVLSLIFDSVLQLSSLSLLISPSTISIFKMAIFLFSTYFGVILTLRFADEIFISIPFAHFTKTSSMKKDLILDSSLLSDPRTIDFLQSGILNHQIVLPRFLIKELTQHLETGEETQKMRAQKSLALIKKLESMPSLSLRIHDRDFPEIKDQHLKILSLAQFLQANVIAAEPPRFPLTEETQWVNINNIFQTLKPLTPPGETLTIKVQRYGKEPRQGVGYLEDGTMVVINNGGDYIGEVIDAQVISVKQTSAGRIIFTNALVDESSFDNHPMYEHQHD